MSSTKRRECLIWLREQIQENRDTLGLTHVTKGRGLHGADLSFEVYEGGYTVSVYYLDLPLSRDTLHSILKQNAKQDIATLFICEEDIMPRGKQGEMVGHYEDFHAILQVLTDGRVHIWDGKSVIEVHYERIQTNPLPPANQRKFHRGSTIDVAGLQVMEIQHGGDILPDYSIGVRFTNDRFWEARTKQDEPFTGGFAQGGFASPPPGYDHTDNWDAFFRQNFNGYYEEFVRQSFFNGAAGRNSNRQNNAGRNKTQNGSKPSSYEVLGISPSASNDEVKKAYRSLVKQWHPDTHEDKAKAEQMTKQLNDAYSSIKKARGIK